MPSEVVPFAARPIVATGIAVTFVLAMAPIAAAQVVEPTSRPSAWRGGISFDEDARDAMRLRAHADREAAATTSDVFLAMAVLGTAGIDALAVPLVQRDQVLAWDASAAHVLGLGLTLLLGEIVKGAAGRARPFERECREEPRAARCLASDTFESFYSLHAGVAFASAGTSCALHASRGLYGDVVADAFSCALSLALAATTGLLRVASDRHYVSDVVVGAVVGFLVGYVVPLLLLPERPGPTVTTIQLTSMSIGVSRTF